jgi:hypothetical protein
MQNHDRNDGIHAPGESFAPRVEYLYPEVVRVPKIFDCTDRCATFRSEAVRAGGQLATSRSRAFPFLKGDGPPSSARVVKSDSSGSTRIQRPLSSPLFKKTNRQEPCRRLPPFLQADRRRGRTSRRPGEGHDRRQRCSATARDWFSTCGCGCIQTANKSPVLLSYCVH